MKNLNTYLMALLMLVFALACSNNNPDTMPDPDDEVPVNFYDTASLTTILRAVPDSVPSWETLERYTDNAQRLPLPAFEKRALAWFGLGDENPFDDDFPFIINLINYNKNIVDQYNANGSSAMFTTMAPYDWEIEVPYPLDILDIRLRATTVLFLREKEMGYPTTFVNFYPPFIDFPVFNTRDEFETWFSERFLPEKEAEAKAAELMKAEKMIPLPVELEIFVRDLGGIGNGGFMDGASNADMLEFAREVRDRILATVKPHYNGKVVAHVYNNYMNPDNDFWDQMTYEGFDEINMAFFPPFDPETTEIYMEEQLMHYMKIVENSGNIPWFAAEVSVFEWYVEDGQFEAYEKDMYEIAFDKIDNARIPPSGISAAGGYMFTQEAKDYLAEYFLTR